MNHKNSTSASPLEKALRNNTVWEIIEIGPISMSIKRIRNMDLLIDAISDDVFNQDERLPYWAELWPSALALSHFLLEQAASLKGKKILEIGCGLGVTGIAATYCGGDVLFTDYEPLALKFTRINFRRNFKRAPLVEYMDWREPFSDRKFDIILAADVLYEKRWLDPVIDVLSPSVEAGGVAYIAEPNRAVAKDFFPKINKLNWKHQSQLKKVSVGNKLNSVSIHRIYKC